MKRSLIPVLVAVLVVSLGGLATADESTWHFGTNPKHTNITFTSKTDLETIVGHTNKVTGTAVADLADGRVDRINLTVPVDSLRTGIAMRDEHLRSPMWLHAEQHPNITFQATDGRKLDGHKWEVSGTFAMHGQTQPLTATVEVREIPARLAERVGLGDGDWVRVTARFPITITDFGVTIPDVAAAKVRETWHVEIAITGTTQKPDATMDAGESYSAGGDYDLPTVSVPADSSGDLFAFGRKPQMTNISIESKTGVETIVTHTNVITGEAAVDVPNGTGTVRLLVPVASLRTGIAMRDEHLRSPMWLHAEEHPYITFESTEVEKIDYLTYRVTGTFSMHGQSKTITTEVTMRPVGPDQMKAAGFGDGNQKGLQFNATFNLKLSDFGVTIPDVAAAKVNDELAVTFSAVAVEKVDQ